MRKKYKIEKTNIDGETNITILPDKDFTLFRYRVCNENNFTALLSDEVWGSSPSSFNDPYDTEFVIKIEDMEAHAKKVLSQDQLIQLAEDYSISVNKNDGFLKELCSVIYLDNLKMIKNMTLTVCLSTVYNSEIMWSHYADDGRGFLIEYSFSDIRKLIKSHAKTVHKNFDSITDANGINDFDKNSIKNYDCYPIQYDDIKYDLTDIFLKIIDFYKTTMDKDMELNELSDLMVEKFYDPTMSKKISDNINFIKNKNWKYEKEWRAVSLNRSFTLEQQNSMHEMVGYLKPKAIYLGEFMSRSDKFTLLSIALKKDIKVYEMYSVLTKKKRGLKRKVLSTNDVKKMIKNLSSNN